MSASHTFDDDIWQVLLSLFAEITSELRQTFSLLLKHFDTVMYAMKNTIKIQ